jgi:hypothetical protein
MFVAVVVFGEQIDVLERRYSDTQDNVIFARRATDLRVQNVDASSTAQRPVDDGILPQQRLQLLGNVRFSWAHIGAIVNDGVADEENAFLRHDPMPPIKPQFEVAAELAEPRRLNVSRPALHHIHVHLNILFLGQTW